MNFRNNECCIISLVIAKSNVTLSKIMFCLRMCVYVYVRMITCMCFNFLLQCRTSVLTSNVSPESHVLHVPYVTERIQFDMIFNNTDHFYPLLRVGA